MKKGEDLDRRAGELNGVHGGLELRQIGEAVPCLLLLLHHLRSQIIEALLLCFVLAVNKEGGEGGGGGGAVEIRREDNVIFVLTKSSTKLDETRKPLAVTAYKKETARLSFSGNKILEKVPC
uniref:Uncharacterized protein n=1 Tax=Salix viminalis TaxID=40686 RepID=A0A6N2KGZ1_SALVM